MSFVSNHRGIIIYNSSFQYFLNESHLYNKAGRNEINKVDIVEEGIRVLIV